MILSVAIAFPTNAAEKDLVIYEICLPCLRTLLPNNYSRDGALSQGDQSGLKEAH